MNLSRNSPQVLHNFMPMSSSQEEAETARTTTNFVQLQMKNVQQFWNKQLLEIHTTSVSRSYHQLPLARVKRIIKSNGVVKMISSETPILFSRACELFIMELTLRVWLQTEVSKRRTLQKCYIAKAIRNDQLLHHFLAPIVLCTIHYDHEDENESELETATRKNVGDDPSTTNATALLHLPVTNQNVADELNQLVRQFVVDPPPMPSPRGFPSK